MPDSANGIRRRICSTCRLYNPSSLCFHLRKAVAKSLFPSRRTVEPLPQHRITHQLQSAQSACLSLRSRSMLREEATSGCMQVALGDDNVSIQPMTTCRKSRLDGLYIYILRCTADLWHPVEANTLQSPSQLRSEAAVSVAGCEK
jgi:hypothetical protein